MFRENEIPARLAILAGGLLLAPWLYAHGWPWTAIGVMLLAVRAAYVIWLLGYYLPSDKVYHAGFNRMECSLLHYLEGLHPLSGLHDGWSTAWLGWRNYLLYQRNEVTEFGASREYDLRNIRVEIRRHVRIETDTSELSRDAASRLAGLQIAADAQIDWDKLARYVLKQAEKYGRRPNVLVRIGKSLPRRNQIAWWAEDALPAAMRGFVQRLDWVCAAFFGVYVLGLPLRLSRGHYFSAATLTIFAVVNLFLWYRIRKAKRHVSKDQRADAVFACLRGLLAWCDRNPVKVNGFWILLMVLAVPQALQEGHPFVATLFAFGSVCLAGVTLRNWWTARKAVGQSISRALVPDASAPTFLNEDHEATLT